MQEPITITANMVTTHLVEIMAAITSGLILWRINNVTERWLERAEKVDELYTTMNGIDNGLQMEGVVDILESHEEYLDDQCGRMTDLKDSVEANRRKMENIEMRIEQLRQKVQSRDNTN